MNPVEVYREAVAPPIERCLKLVLKPSAWRARMWRAFDDSVTTMLRLDAPLSLIDVADRNLHGLLAPFQPVLRTVSVYLERGAGNPLPLPWSVGWLSVEHDRQVAFLHRVLDDPFGNELATLFRAGDSEVDVTLSLAAYEIASNRLVFAIRDYDIGVWGDFRR